MALQGLKALYNLIAGKLTKSSNLSDLTNAGTARTNLGLGTAATQNTSAFDAAGAASTVQTNLTTHTGNTSNPHGVTKAQVGLSNVANVAALPLTGGTVSGDVTVNTLNATDLSINGGAASINSTGTVTAYELIGPLHVSYIQGMPNYWVINDPISIDGGAITSDGGGFFSATDLDAVDSVYAGGNLNYGGWINHNGGSVNYDRFQADSSGNIYCVTINSDSGSIATNGAGVITVVQITCERISSDGGGVSTNGSGKLTAGQLNLNGIPTYADNDAATLGGLTAGDVYMTATGELRITIV